MILFVIYDPNIDTSDEYLDALDETLVLEHQSTMVQDADGDADGIDLSGIFADYDNLHSMDLPDVSETSGAGHSQTDDSTVEYNESNENWNSIDTSTSTEEPSQSEDVEIPNFNRRERSKRDRKAPKKLTYDRVGRPSIRRNTFM